MARMVWLALLAALVAGCGSGGSSGSADGHGRGSTPETTKAVVTVSARSAAAGTVLYGVQFTVDLPTGVTVPANATTGEVSSGVLHTYFTVDAAGAKYTPATATAKGSVKVVMAAAGGFTTGDLATITCAVPPGSTVAAAGFRLHDFSAMDANGAAIAGVTPALTVETE